MNNSGTETENRLWEAPNALPCGRPAPCPPLLDFVAPHRALRCCARTPSFALCLRRRRNALVLTQSQRLSQKKGRRSPLIDIGDLVPADWHWAKALSSGESGTAVPLLTSAASTPWLSLSLAPAMLRMQSFPRQWSVCAIDA